MNKDNYLLKEYDRINKEIASTMKLHNSLLTFTITTVVAILTFAITKDKPMLYLMPFCILIPMSERIYYYRYATAKLAGYMIVYIEEYLDGINWETRNEKLMTENLKNKQTGKKSFSVLRYNECLILSIVSYALFFVAYLDGKALDFLNFIFLFAAALLVKWEYNITKRINNIDTYRIEWADRWRDWKDNSETSKN